MKKIIVITLFASIFCISCQKGIDSLEDKISIKLPSNPSEVKNLSETGGKYFDLMEYVQLNSNENVFIGEIDKIIVTSDRIYILDIFKFGGIIIYDRGGQVINTIKKTGQGPEEYNYVFGIFYDEQDETINLLCRYPNKIMKFDKDGNKLVNQFNLPVALLDIKKSNKGYYVGYAGSSSIICTHSIFIFSKEFKHIHSLFPNKSEWRTYKMDNTLSVYNGEVYFTPMYGYTIYKENDESLIPQYEYDFASYGISVDEQNDNTDYNRYVNGIDKFQETTTNSIVVFLFKGTYLISFYSKEDSRIETYQMIDNPLNKLNMGKFISMDENCLVTYIEAEQVSVILNNHEIKKRIPKGVDALQQAMKHAVGEYDDPVLCIYHHK